MGAMRRPEIATAADRMADVVAAVDMADLDRPTPCAEYDVAALLDHVDGFVVAFTAAATKTQDPDDGPPGPGTAANLRADWKTALPAGLTALVAAWRPDDAYTGTVRAGGFEMPAASVAVVAIEELVVHGWDLARAVGRPYGATSAELAALDDFFGQFGPEQRGSAYGPERSVDAGASPLDHAIARSGRDPRWSTVR
jgi:uncharacterized protein (TIGR03086 family)